MTLAAALAWQEQAEQTFQAAVAAGENGGFQTARADLVAANKAVGEAKEAAMK